MKGPVQPKIEDDLSVKLIGLGGIGGIAARYAAVFLGSLDVGTRLVLIDGDAFEPKNASRMLFREHGNKAEVLCGELLGLLGEDSSVELTAIPEYVSVENVQRLIHNSDVALLAVDNHATRKIVDDHCRTLNNVCLISAGNDGVGPDSTGRETRGVRGSCQIHHRRNGEDMTPPISRFHPEIAEPADVPPDQAGCGEQFASNPQILCTNLLAASMLISTFYLHTCGAGTYAELHADMEQGAMRALQFNRW